MPAPQGRRQLLSAAAGAALLAASALQAPDAQAVIKVRRLDRACVMQGWGCLHPLDEVGQAGKRLPLSASTV